MGFQRKDNPFLTTPSQLVQRSPGVSSQVQWHQNRLCKAAFGEKPIRQSLWLKEGFLRLLQETVLANQAADTWVTVEGSHVAGFQLRSPACHVLLPGPHLAVSSTAWPTI